MAIKILIIDDRDDNLELMAQMLDENNMEPICVKSGEEGIKAALEEKPQVIILDIQMPGMDGYEVCRRLKQNEETKNIPVIFLTASETTEDKVVKGLELGAYDYLIKPFREKELIARISVMVKIKKAEDDVREESYTDSLTNLYNRRFLEKRFEEEISRSRRSFLALGCFLLDIDHFKSINDLYGHPFGDFVLVETARIIRENLRAYDTVARYGGEEFVVVLPSTKYEDAMIVAEKIRRSVENSLFTKDGNSTSVTVSIGVYCGSGEDLSESYDHFIRKADEALYKAKGNGRNLVLGYRDLYE